MRITKPIVPTPPYAAPDSLDEVGWRYFSCKCGRHIMRLTAKCKSPIPDGCSSCGRLMVPLFYVTFPSERRGWLKQLTFNGALANFLKEGAWCGKSDPEGMVVVSSLHYGHEWWRGDQVFQKWSAKKGHRFLRSSSNGYGVRYGIFSVTIDCAELALYICPVTYDTVILNDPHFKMWGPFSRSHAWTKKPRTIAQRLDRWAQRYEAWINHETKWPWSKIPGELTAPEAYRAVTLDMPNQP